MKIHILLFSTNHLAELIQTDSQTASLKADTVNSILEQAKS